MRSKIHSSNYFLTALFMYCLLVLIVSCNDEKYYHCDTSGHIRDSIFGKHKMEVDLFFTKLEWIQEVQDFTKPLIVLDSNTSKEKIKKYMQEASAFQSFCTDSIALAQDNFIVVNNKTNLSFMIDNDSAIRKSDAAYYITVFGYDQGEFSPVDIVPDYWYYHHNPGMFQEWRDSVYPEQKVGIIEGIQKELKVLPRIQYCILVRDMFIVLPKLVTTDTFLPGELITKVQLYDIGSKKLLCQAIVQSQNSEKISHMYVGISGELLTYGLNSRLIEDFHDQKNQQILNLFKLDANSNKQKSPAGKSDSAFH